MGVSLKCLARVGTITQLPNISGVSGVGNLSNLCVGPDERLWSTTENLSSIPVVVAMTLAGVTSTYTVTGAGTGDNFGGICTDGTYIYVADQTAKRIFKFNTAGTVIASTSPTLLSTAGIGGLAGIQFFTGQIFFADNNNGNVGVINPDLATGLVVRATPGGGAHGLNIGPDGFGNEVLWFAEQSANKVAAMTAAGVFTEFPTFTTFGSGGPTAISPYYVIDGGDGNVYFTSRAGGVYGQILLPSGIVTTFLGPGSGAGPGGMWADPYGFIWYCDENQDLLVEFPTDDLDEINVYQLPSGVQPDKIVLGPYDGIMAFTMHNAGTLGLVQSGPIAVAPAPFVTVFPVTPPSATQGTPTSVTVNATASDGGALTFATSALPGGLSITSTTSTSATISGTPTGSGTSTITVTATETSTGASSSTMFSWTINSSGTGSVTVTNPGAQTGFVGTSIGSGLHISATDTAGGTLTFAATGLPPGLAINSTTGVITGTPTSATNSPYSVTVTATDSHGPSGSATFTWTITSPTVTFPSPPGNQLNPTGTALSLTITAHDTAQSPSITWSATGLPPGLSIASTGGSGSTYTAAITGTPTTTGSYNVTVKAADANGQFAQASFTWTISSSGGGVVGSAFQSPLAQFASGNVWITRVDGLGSSSLDSSAQGTAIASAFIAEFAREIAANIGPFVDTTNYSVPVYTVPATPAAGVTVAPVGLNPNRPAFIQANGGVPGIPAYAQTLQAALQASPGVPIPNGAVGASGKDQHLVIYQPSTDTMWEFWHMCAPGQGWNYTKTTNNPGGVINTSGQWLCEWGGIVRNVSTNPGYFVNVSGSPSVVEQAGWGGDAASLPLVAGLITPAELAAGPGGIQHALSFAANVNLKAAWSVPAQRTDGSGSMPPSGKAVCVEGSHWRLDPTVNLAGLGLTGATLTIATAIQQYGMICRDTAGCITFYCQDPTPTGTNPYASATTAFGSALFGGKGGIAVLAGIPWQHLQLLQMTNGQGVS